ncbi:MAG: sugar phosphate isomerase/epimerase, partial [Clostridia bacterium]|nr:sugar phosphate isomerase/epimerase [Clostridia bacterium]
SELIKIVRGMGYNAIEFPLRDGAQVSPAEAEEKLPKLVQDLGDGGIRIDDVASTPEERVFAACRASGIPMIRVMFMPPPGGNYLEEEQKYLSLVDGWVPHCERYGVKVGIQMHYGTGASNTAEMMRIVGRYDPKHIGAIWDAAHSGLAGELPEQAIDLCASHLALVNFKAARYQMAGRAADGAAEFTEYFCPGPDGQCSWPRAVKHLIKIGYSGTWCMPAEYTGLTHTQEAEYAKRDLLWLKSLVEG